MNPVLNIVEQLLASLPLPVLAGATLLSVLTSLCSFLLFCLSRTRTGAKKRDSDLAESVAQLRTETETQRQQVGEMALRLEDLRKRFESMEAGTPPKGPVWNAPETSINLNFRGQVLRLSKKGKSVAEIAEDLRLSQGEVQLILKIHDMSQDNPVAAERREAATSSAISR